MSANSLKGPFLAARLLAHEHEHLTNVVLVAVMLLGAYLLRVLYPTLFMTGYDMPAHVMASLRLHDTSFLVFTSWLENTAAQAVLYNHGYTTILLPWLLYEFFFSLLRFPITEVSLVFIHSILGILSIASITWFLWLNFGRRVALASALIIAVIPAHVGLSRVHVGTQIIGSIFFFLCLSLLHQYIAVGKNRWRNLYYIAVFFYIGSENIFLAGLFVQVLYLLLLAQNQSIRSRIAVLRGVAFHPFAVLAVGLPVMAYLAAAVYSYSNGMGGGYLDRLLSKIARAADAPMLDGFQPVVWMFQLFGPIIIVPLALLPMAWHAHAFRREGSWTAWLLAKLNKQDILIVIFLIYYSMLAASQNVEHNYVYSLLVPVVVGACLVLLRRQSFYLFGVIITLVYMLGIVYNLPLPFSVKKNYGSVMPSQPVPEQAIKSLGAVYRADALLITTGQFGMVTWTGFFSSYPGSFYYLGAQTSRRPERDISQGALDRFDSYLVAVSADESGDADNYLLDVVRERDLRLVGSVTGSGAPLIYLYANQPPDALFALERLPQAAYQVKPDGTITFVSERLNLFFDRQYATLETLPRRYLGQWGFRFPDGSNESPVNIGSQ